MMIPSIQKHTLFLTIVTLSVSLQATSPYPEMPKQLKDKREAHIELVEGLFHQLNGTDKNGIQHAQEHIQAEILAHAKARNAKICRHPHLYAFFEWVSSWFDSNSSMLKTELDNTEKCKKAGIERLKQEALFYQKAADRVLNIINETPKQLDTEIASLNGVAAYVRKNSHSSSLSDNEKTILKEYDPTTSKVKKLIFQKAMILHGSGIPLTYEEIQKLLFKNPAFQEKAQTADSLQTQLTEIYNKEFATTYTHYPCHLSVILDDQQPQNDMPTDKGNSDSATVDSENTVES